jgi:hypothetical protein
MCHINFPGILQERGGKDNTANKNDACKLAISSSTIKKDFSKINKEHPIHGFKVFSHLACTLDEGESVF